MLPGSFRYCLAEAQEFGGGHVVFDVSGTIKDGLPDNFEERAGRDIEPTGRDLYPELDNIEIYLDELAETLLNSAT